MPGTAAQHASTMSTTAHGGIFWSPGCEESADDTDEYKEDSLLLLLLLSLPSAAAVVVVVMLCSAPAPRAKRCRSACRVVIPSAVDCLRAWRLWRRVCCVLALWLWCVPVWWVAALLER